MTHVKGPRALVQTCGPKSQYVSVPQIFDAHHVVSLIRTENVHLYHSLTYLRCPTLSFSFYKKKMALHLHLLLGGRNWRVIHESKSVAQLFIRMKEMRPS